MFKKLASGDNYCSRDWLTIPCALSASLGTAETSLTLQSSHKFPGGNPRHCVDRICGEDFCSEPKKKGLSDHGIMGHRERQCAVFSEL